MSPPRLLHSVCLLEYLNDGVSRRPLRVCVWTLMCVYVRVCARADTGRAGQTRSEGSVL